MTSKTEANGPTHAITQHPLPPLDRAVRHGGCSGKCESLTMPCNTERGLWGLPDCITVPICLGGVFHVTLGVTELWHVTPRQEQRYLSISTCLCDSMKRSATFMGFRSQILTCHILLAYIKVRTCLSSSHCIMLFFVNVDNTHYTVTQCEIVTPCMCAKTLWGLSFLLAISPKAERISSKK